METKLSREEIINSMAEVLKEKYGFATVTQIDQAVADILKKTAERVEGRRNTFSLSTMIRGLRAMRGESVVESTREADITYCRALSTGATPGSYLVPTVQANEIIAMLSLGGVARASGARVWPMAGQQKLSVPAALTSPTWEWVGQNSSTVASDANLGQMNFDLKERRALTTVPNQLIAVSVPAFDTMLSELLAMAGAEHEDVAIFATSTVSGGPVAMRSAASISTVNCAGSANGGNISYNVDITAVLAKAASVKARGGFCWYMSPRTYYQRILGLLDLSSRPLVIPSLSQGLQNVSGTQIGAVAPAGMLMGYPVWVTPAIKEDQALGSGSSQSHVVFTNPRYIHIAEDGNIEIAIATERYFEFNMTGIRCTQHLDLGFAPPTGIVCLLGVN